MQVLDKNLAINRENASLAAGYDDVNTHDNLIFQKYFLKLLFLFTYYLNL